MESIVLETNNKGKPLIVLTIESNMYLDQILTIYYNKPNGLRQIVCSTVNYERNHKTNAECIAWANDRVVGFKKTQNVKN